MLGWVWKLLLLVLLVLLPAPRGLLSAGRASADTDSAEDSDPDASVDEEEEDEEEEPAEEEGIRASDGDDDDAEDKVLSSHSDADTTVVFTAGEEFHANEIVRFLVGLTNKGAQEFTVQSLEASLRYPQNFQLYIHNFTALALNTVVHPAAQASFEYSFIAAQPLAGRPIGLVVLLSYLDSEGNVFQSAVYNQTVTITEKEEGLDGETMFMYVFLVGLLVLMLFGLYQVLESRTKKRLPVKMEKGTGGMSDVDISWIPQETLNVMNKASPKTSPRKRTKRAAGADQ